MERTLAGAVAACTGLAVAAYGGEIRRALISGGDGGGIEGEKTAAEGFVGFQRSYLAVQALATFVDFIQGPFLYKVYADTFGLGTVRPSVRLLFPCLPSSPTAHPSTNKQYPAHTKKHRTTSPSSTSWASAPQPSPPPSPGPLQTPTAGAWAAWPSRGCRR